MFRGFEPGAFKMVKISMTFFYFLWQILTPVSFRVDVQDATTELQDSIKYKSNTIYLIRTYVTVLLARPSFINSSATHS